MGTRIAAGFAIALSFVVAARDWLSRLAITLSNSTSTVMPVPKMRDIQLRQRDADQVLALTADQLAVGHILPQIFANFPPHDFSEASSVAIDLHRHGVRAVTVK